MEQKSRTWSGFRDLNPEPIDWQSSTLATRPPRKHDGAINESVSYVSSTYLTFHTLRALNIKITFMYDFNKIQVTIADPKMPHINNRIPCTTAVL